MTSAVLLSYQSIRFIKEVPMINPFNLSVWFLVLLVTLIGTAWLLSLLPQNILWVIFIIVLGYIVLQIKGRC